MNWYIYQLYILRLKSAKKKQKIWELPRVFVSKLKIPPLVELILSSLTTKLSFFRLSSSTLDWAACKNRFLSVIKHQSCAKVKRIFFCYLKQIGEKEGEVQFRANLVQPNLTWTVDQPSSLKSSSWAAWEPLSFLKTTMQWMRLVIHTWVQPYQAQLAPVWTWPS